MVKPLSLDLRMRVAAALGEGMSVRAAAQRFGVSVASAVRMGQRARSGEGLAPRSSGGHRHPVLLGAAEGEGAGLAAETVTNGDPTFAGPLAGVSLGLRVYHVCEPEVKAEFDEAVYDEQVGMMEMVLDVDDIVSEMISIREQYCAFKD